MKKILFILFGLLMFSFSMTLLSSCDFIIDIQNIEIIEQPENAIYEIGEFNYDDYTMLITYTDGKTETKKLDESMLSDYDKLLLKSAGTHEITISYEGHEISLTVEINYKQVEDDEEDQIVKPYIEPIDTVYDGNPKLITIKGDIPENATIYYPSGQSFTDAGEYKATAIVTAEGFETMYLSTRVLIRKATYDLSNVSLVVDYGVDKQNNPLTSFVYDGKEHSATLVGEIPQGLSEPEYYIGLRNKPVSTYSLGNSATNAGNYVVIAKFSGDTKNYNVDNLEISTELIIEKKPITQEGFDSLSYPTKYVDYDGLPHRYVIDDLVLPAGVSIEYLDENGKQFGSRTEANEEGYKITAKFVSNDQNYDLTNTIDLLLVIHRVAFKIDPEDIVVGFDGNQEINFDNEEHQVTVDGLAEGITIKTLTINEEEKTSVKDAGTYNVYVEFNPFNSNYLPIDPIETTLTINKISFTAISYQFEDKLDEIYDEDKHSLEYENYSMPLGVSVSFTYQTDTDFDIHQGIPQDIENVGTYTCVGKFTYDKNNYTDAPDSVDDITATMIISPRVYDAKSVITLNAITTFYRAGVNNINLCTFDEILPSWISSYRVLVYANNGTTSTRTVTDAGEYQYEFEFFYFDGLENTSSITNRETLKVIGITINSTDYKVSYSSTGVYDGIHSCLPNIELFFDESVNASWNLDYYFQGFDDEEATLVDQSEWETVSKNAGTHTFSYTISARNYEPLIKTYTIVVDRKSLLVNHLYYSVSNYEGVYDGNTHDNQIKVDAAAGNNIVAVPKLLNSSEEGLIPGNDVGTYEYTVEFKTDNPNYVLVLDTFYSFNYTVKINSIEMSKPGELFAFTLDNSTEHKEVTVTKNETFYSQLASFMKVNDDKPITTQCYEFTGTYNLLGYLLSLQMPNNELEKSSLIDMTYVIYNKDTNETSLVDSISDVNEIISEAGTYLILAKFSNKNITVNGYNGILYQVKINPYAINLYNPEKVLSSLFEEITSSSSSEFNIVGEGISSIVGDTVDEVTAFDGTMMLNYKTTYFGSSIIVNLEKNLSSDIVSDMNAKYYLVKVSSKGEILKDSAFNSIFSMANGDYLTISDSSITDSAVYYVFVDLGTNYSYLSNRRIVYKITVEGKQYNITDIINLVNSNNEDAAVYNANNFRKYITEKSKLICALENNSPVQNADAVTNTNGYTGVDIYTYSVDFYNDLYSFDLFKRNFSEEELSQIKLDVIFAGYSVTNGGKTISTLSTDTYFRKSKITASELQTYINDLYLSNSQKQFTPVGVYYMFITFDSSNIQVNGNNKIAVCVQVNRSTDAKYYTYTYNGKTYNYLTDGLVSGLSTQFVDNKYVYDISDKSLLPLSEKITSLTTDEFSFDYTRDVSTWFSSPLTCNNVEITFNQEMYGGYVLKLNSCPVNMYYEKRTIDLDTTFTKAYAITTDDSGKTLEYKGTVYSYTEWENNVGKYFEDRLCEIGVDTHIAKYFGDNYISYTRQFTNGSSDVYLIGTFYLDLLIGYTKSESSLTTEQKAVKTCIKSLFDFTHGTTLYKDNNIYNDSYRLVSKSGVGVSIVIAKKSIYITRYIAENSPIYKEDNIKISLTDAVALNAPQFAGYIYDRDKILIRKYTSEDNLFKSCIITDTSRSLCYDDFGMRCITMDWSSYTGKITYTIELDSNYAQYYQIVERRVTILTFYETSTFIPMGSSYTFSVNLES